MWIPNNKSNFDVPILLFHGIHDKITTPTCSIIAFNSIINKEKEIILLPNSEHNLLVENNPDDLTTNFVYVKILNWNESRLV